MSVYCDLVPSHLTHSLSVTQSLLGTRLSKTILIQFTHPNPLQTPKSPPQPPNFSILSHFPLSWQEAKAVWGISRNDSYFPCHPTERRTSKEKRVPNTRRVSFTQPTDLAIILKFGSCMDGQKPKKHVSFLMCAEYNCAWPVESLS